MSVACNYVRRCGKRGLVGGEADKGSTCVSRFRGAQHFHGGRLFEEDSPPDWRGGCVMATLARPLDEREPVLRRPNIASADVQLPAVRDYEQVDREISATLHPTVAWFIALGTAIFFLLLGISAWMYQIYSGLGVAGYNPPVMWGVYFITCVFWVGIGPAREPGRRSPALQRR